MQYITHWPDMAELAVPETIAQDLYRQLLEPFDSVASAKEFWNETSSALIILDHTDNITDLKQSDVYREIEFALTYPEYTVPLAMGYVLMVTIVSTGGCDNIRITLDSNISTSYIELAD